MAGSVVQSSRSRDLDKLLLRPGNLIGANFEPGSQVGTSSSLWHFVEYLVFSTWSAIVLRLSCFALQLRDDLQQYVKVLVIGAGGWAASSWRTWLCRVSGIWKSLTWIASKLLISIVSFSSGFNYFLGSICIFRLLFVVCFLNFWTTVARGVGLEPLLFVDWILRCDDFSNWSVFLSFIHYLTDDMYIFMICYCKSCTGSRNSTDRMSHFTWLEPFS